MKQVKKFLSAVLIAAMLTVVLAGCGSKPSSENPSSESKATGTLMWLSNLSSGAQYDATLAYAEMITNNLGYKFKVVYGDPMNDPAGNLNAVKNAMTNDVVGLISSQDGGIQNIMDAYPNLVVVGYNTDMASVYTENGPSKAVATNNKFLGTIADGFVDGKNAGQEYANAVIDKGYKKVSVIIFPAFAFPQMTVADQEFREVIADYNKTASADKQIQIVGDTKVLEFKPLEAAYFLQEGYGDLDAIVGICAMSFVYPPLKSAIADGSCSAKTKLIARGFENDKSLIADIGGDGVIQYIVISPCEDIAWSIVMLDNAINGKMYADYTASERVDSLSYVIDSKEAIDNVMSKSVLGTGKPENAQISMDDLKKVLTRYNDKATYADLKALFQSDQLEVAALAKK